MSVKTTSHIPTVITSQKQKVGLALRLMIEAIDAASTPSTPRDKGDLRNNKRKQVLGLTATIAWVVNYASVQEQKQFGNYTTAGTGPHFAQNAVKRIVSNANTFFKQAGLEV